MLKSRIRIASVAAVALLVMAGVLSGCVPGETIADCLRAVRSLAGDQLLATIDYLGEDTTTPEQALAVFECLQALRQALWSAYGPQVQQAWREQLMPDGQAPELDPDEPF